MLDYLYRECFNCVMDKAIQSYLEKWLGGDESAYQPVFRHYYQRLLSFAIRFLKDRAQAEEITMDTLLKVWQNREIITGAGSFQSYIFVILRNELVSVSRKKKPHMVPIDGFENQWQAENPEYIWETRRVLEQYQHCLSRLSPKRREVFLLSREEGLSHADIARQLGLSVFTVKNHIKAALQFLKTELPHTGVVSVLYGTFLLDSLNRLQALSSNVILM
ncbi:UNVERIFIED_ORG: RNA polymerase sigma-70 factor (ECF subfamily) [Chitinophaga ginsengisegetis]